MTERLSFANEMADRAGEMILRGRNQSPSVRVKSNGTFVTDLDIAIKW
jgi:fructose-1,6-bisphosphatase/inositol monophosphatase family enzyme